MSSRGTSAWQVVAVTAFGAAVAASCAYLLLGWNPSPPVSTVGPASAHATVFDNNDALDREPVKLHPLPERPKVVFLGDSWTEGYAAKPETKGYAYVASDLLGWDSSIVPKGSGTGYLNPGPDRVGTYETRLRQMAPNPEVDLVVVQGGLNDESMPDGATLTLNRAVATAWGLAHRLYPNAQLLAVGPLSPLSPQASTKLVAIDDRIRYESLSEGVAFISPLEEHWFPDEQAIAKYVDTGASNHPNTIGHAYFARRLAADVRKLS